MRKSHRKRICMDVRRTQQNWFKIARMIVMFRKNLGVRDEFF